jgi:hypothetical protein
MKNAFIRLALRAWERFSGVDCFSTVKIVSGEVTPCSLVASYQNFGREFIYSDIVA